MAPDSPRKRLPFEPSSKGQGSGKSAAKASPTSASPFTAATPAQTAKATAIPEEVSRRMLRRMLIFSGLPTFLGVVIFFASYFLMIKGIASPPSYFVLLSTLGCFGLGVVGLTYGVLSASWDELRPGTRVGLEEFKVNFGRMTNAWGSKEKQ